jgi:hypothetical protein
MSRPFRFVAVFVGVVSFAASGPLFAQAQRAVGYLHEVSGSATVQESGGLPHKTSKGDTLVNGATVVTGPQSYVVLKFEDGTVVVLKEDTSFQIQSYSYNATAPEVSTASFNMVRGGLRMITGLVTYRNQDALRVATPMATISARGTHFLAELTNPLLVQVISGAVGVANTAGTATVVAGQVATVTSPSTLGTVRLAGTMPGPTLPDIVTPPATPGPIPVVAGGAATTGAVAAGGGGGTATGGGTIALGVAAAAAVAAGLAAAGGGGGGAGTPPRH